MGLLCNITKASSIKDWPDRLAKQSSELENKIHQKFKLVDAELWIELDLENNNNS